MSDLQQLIDKGSQWAMYTAEGKALIAKVYKERYGEEISCSTCPSVIYSAYLKLKNNTMTTLKKNPISINYAKGEAFVLKKGIAFYAGDGTRITDKRPVSNEHAIEYIARHESHINHFDSVNSEVLDAALKPEETKEKSVNTREAVAYSDMKLPALKALAAERNLDVTGTAKQVFIDALEAADKA